MTATLTRDMVVNRQRLLADITRRELRWIARPYETSETAAAYVEASALLNDEFDTTDMPVSFCPDCGHDPCVADYGSPRFATPGQCIYSTPRELSVGRVRWPIIDAGVQLPGLAAKVFAALVPAIYHLSGRAIYSDDNQALDILVEIRDNMRRAVAK